MECLTGSTSKIFAPDYHINEFKANLILPRSATFCTNSANVIRIMQHHLHNNSCYSITSFSHSSSSSPATPVTHCLSSSNPEVLSSETTGMCKLAKVKFQMEEECQYGDHFLMVGDDSILGSWNPCNAIPFDWSEGHMWSLMLEMPVEKSIRYKFLLKTNSGEILWQPGPDRVFQSWLTDNVIVVSEEWENAEAQKISEVHEIEIVGKTLVHDPSVVSLKQDPVPIVAEKIEVSGSNENLCAEDCTGTRNRPVLNLDNGAYLKENPSSRAIATNMGISFQENGPTRKSHVRAVRVDKSLVEAEDEGNLVIYDEGPVLVPGLTLPLMSSENVCVKEQQKSIIADAQKQGHTR